MRNIALVQSAPQKNEEFLELQNTSPGQPNAASLQAREEYLHLVTETVIAQYEGEALNYAGTRIQEAMFRGLNEEVAAWQSVWITIKNAAGPGQIMN